MRWLCMYKKNYCNNNQIEQNTQKYYEIQHYQMIYHTSILSERKKDEIFRERKKEFKARAITLKNVNKILYRFFCVYFCVLAFSFYASHISFFGM